MRGLTIGLALAGLLAGAGTANADLWIDTAIEQGTAYMTICNGGPVDVAIGWDNDVWVTCAMEPDEHVICARPGAVDWFGESDQIVVTCSADDPK